MRKLTILACAMATLLMMCSFAQASTIIYDNGGPNQQNGNEMTEWIQSEDFTFASSQTITDVHFWDIDQSTYAGSISWWITGDNGGNPNLNDILASGSSLTNVHTATGVCVAFGCEFTNDFNIDPLMLGAGTYHLLLHNGDLTNNSREEFYWETTDPNGTPTGRECEIPSGTCAANSWSDNFQEHAFYLTGGTTTTPEPGTLVLMASGLLGAFSQLRRRF